MGPPCNSGDAHGGLRFPVFPTTRNPCTHQLSHTLGEFDQGGFVFLGGSPVLGVTQGRAKGDHTSVGVQSHTFRTPRLSWLTKLRLCCRAAPTGAVIPTSWADSFWARLTRIGACLRLRLSFLGLSFWGGLFATKAVFLGVCLRLRPSFWGSVCD